MSLDSSKMEHVKINMVSHVHWDPMWYSSFQEYRIRLYKLVKKLLHILDTNPGYKHFMFDGQVSAIEDYLEAAPEDRDRIHEHVKSGRLKIGPWYIQPEEFLISGESLIRNLKLGIESANYMGGCMNVSYLCDPVGHIAQLPQLLKGFGINYFTASRGMLDNDKVKSTEFIWEAPDGSEVLVHSMPKGYSNRLSLNQEDFQRDIQAHKTWLSAFNRTGYMLYAQGADHAEPMEEILELIKEYNRNAGREELSLVTMEEHMKTIEQFYDQLEHYTGELRFSYCIFILSGILTTRMEVKLKNAEVQNGLEKWLEPFSSFNWLLGGSYPEPFINLAWKYQIKNSFHDCIYGAHADHVTPDIMNTYKQADEIIRWNVNEALFGIAERAVKADGRYCTVLFNPTAGNLTNEVVDFAVNLPQDCAAADIAVYNAEGRKLPCQVNGIVKTNIFSHASGNVIGETTGNPVNKVELSVLMDSIPSYGYTQLYVQNEKYVRDETDLNAGNTFCENSLLKMEIRSNGTIDVLDKTSGQMYQGLHYFEDSGDKGDQYNYSATVPQGIITSKTGYAKISLLNNGPVKALYKVEQDLLLPKGLSADGFSRSDEFVENHIVTFITIKAYSGLIEFHTEVENRSGDHKLTIGFPTGIKTDDIYSGSQFYVSKRSVKLPEAAGWDEPPSGFWPHHRFMAVNDGQRQFTFMDRGLTEHKVTDEGDVYITLLRCTSHLSKDTLPERKYRHAGPAMESPLAQELGLHTYDYAISVGMGKQIYECCQASDKFCAPVKGLFINSGELKSREVSLPEKMSFLRILNGDGLMVSAIKKGADDRLVIRLYNTTSDRISPVLKFFRPIHDACRTDLAERFVEKLNCGEDELKLDMDGNKIETVSIKFK